MRTRSDLERPVAPGPRPLLRRAGCPALLSLSVLLNVAEAAVTLAVLPSSDSVLSLQASAVAPFGVFHDLRWLSVFSSSWWSFALEIAAVVVGRGALTALAISLAWPRGGPRPVPSAGALAGRALTSTAAAVVLLTPSTVLLFAMAVVPISWLFIAAVPLAAGVAILLSPLPVVGDSWRRLIPLQVIGWVLLSFVFFTVGAVALAELPPWTAIPLAAVGGVFNAVAWTAVVRALVLRDPSHLVLPVVPVAVVALTLGVILGSVNGFVHARAKVARGHPVAAKVPPGAQPVIIASGYGSTWDGTAEHPVPGSFLEQRFSYRGLGADGAPLPYGSADTVRSLADLVTTLEVQVQHLANATHARVDVVGESEGAIVAETYVLTHPDAPVRSLVLLSPLVAPARVTFPERGDGPGVAARAAMQMLSGAYGSVSPVDLDPTSAFLASVDTSGAVVQKSLTCQVPHIGEFVFLPLADATASTPDVHLAVPHVVVPGFHGGLLGDSGIDAAVAGVLRGHPPAGNLWLDAAERLVTDASTAWQVPLRGELGAVQAGGPLHSECGSEAGNDSRSSSSSRHSSSSSAPARRSTRSGHS